MKINSRQTTNDRNDELEEEMCKWVISDKAIDLSNSEITLHFSLLLFKLDVCIVLD
jgi:hypothetical protein